MLTFICMTTLQVMDSYMRARVEHASVTELQAPAALVLPDVQHLLLLSAGVTSGETEATNSSSSSHSNDINVNDSSSTPQAANVPLLSSASAETTDLTPDTHSRNSQLQYARHLLSFHYRGAGSGGGRSGTDSKSDVTNSSSSKSEVSSSSSREDGTDAPTQSSIPAYDPAAPVFEPLLAKAAQVSGVREMVTDTQKF